MVVAVVKRLATILLLTGAAVTSMGAAHLEEWQMLQTFNEALTAMVYAATGLAFFAIVWAGFVLMAEGTEERSSGRARKRGPGSRHRAGAGPLGQGRGPGAA